MEGSPISLTENGLMASVDKKRAGQVTIYSAGPKNFKVYVNPAILYQMTVSMVNFLTVGKLAKIRPAEPASKAFRFYIGQNEEGKYGRDLYGFFNKWNPAKSDVEMNNCIARDAQGYLFTKQVRIFLSFFLSLTCFVAIFVHLFCFCF